MVCRGYRSRPFVHDVQKEKAAYRPRPWIPENFEEMCGRGPQNRALSKGKLGDEARSPAADRSGSQRISQRGENTRAGAGTEISINSGGPFTDDL